MHARVLQRLHKFVAAWWIGVNDPSSVVVRAGTILLNGRRHPGHGNRRQSLTRLGEPFKSPSFGI